MTDAAGTGLDSTIEPIAPGDLKFDLSNPRMGELEFKTEEAALKHLIEQYDVEELVLFDPDGWLARLRAPHRRAFDGIVIEGNRRLAALRLIADEGLRKKVGYKLPQVDPHHPNAAPEKVSVRFASDRRAAYVYIGFKHINGPFKWDALAKAKFAAD